MIDWIVDLARRIMVRRVKRAYWNAEIKRAQEGGLADFLVCTRKLHTDVAYVACARQLLGARDAVFPQFAIHNAQTLSTVLQIAGTRLAIGDYEFSACTAWVSRSTKRWSDGETRPAVPDLCAGRGA